MDNKKKDIRKNIGIFGSAIIVIALLCFFEEFKSAGKASTATFYAMDTVMKIDVYGDKDAEVLVDCIVEVRKLDELLSTGNEESEVSLLNQEKSIYASKDTYDCIKKALEVYDNTDGAFDITIYPVMKAWGFDTKEYRVPFNEELEKLIKSVNAENVSIYAASEDSDVDLDLAKKQDSEDEGKQLISIPEGVEIDLGGIAKGFTAEKIAEILNRNEIKGALVNLGGNIMAYGSKPMGQPFVVGIENPDSNESYLGTLSVKNKSVVTSGNYERFFTKDGKNYHHIIDPDTGYPVENGLSSVTIVSADATLADAYSTALYVMGMEKATDFWKNHMDEFDVIFYKSDGRLFITKGLKGNFKSDFLYEVIE